MLALRIHIAGTKGPVPDHKYKTIYMSPKTPLAARMNVKIEEMDRKWSYKYSEIEGDGCMDGEIDS